MLTTEDAAATPALRARVADRWRRLARSRPFGWALWAAVFGGVAWAVVRTFGLESGFPAVALIAFTPYVAVLSVFPLLVALAVRRWLAAAVAALVVLAFGVAVLPRAVPDDQGSAGGGPRLRVLTANVHFGEVPAAEVIALVRRIEPDVVAFQELSPELSRELDRAGIGALLPHRILPNGVSQDSGIYARHPLRPVLAGCDPVFAEPCALVEVPGTEPVEVRAVHPAAPQNADDTRKRKASLAALTLAPRDGTVRILAGDFNATLDHVEFRSVLDFGYRDAADAVGAGLLPTWSLRGPAPPMTIDHVLVNPGIKVHRISTHTLPRTDHRALLAELELPG